MLRHSIVCVFHHELEVKVVKVGFDVHALFSVFEAFVHKHEI